MAKSILVVEDDYIIGEDIRMCLTNMGYEVPGVAATSDDAIKLAGGLYYDIVLMDVKLRNNSDGVETAKVLFKQFGIPVIFLTANSDESILDRAREAEPYGFVMKPFSERELHFVIEMAVYKHEVDTGLKKKEKWLQTTLAIIGEGVIYVDNYGKVNFMNPVAEQITGWSIKDAEGRHLIEVFNLTDTDSDGFDNILSFGVSLSKVLEHGEFIDIPNVTIRNALGLYLRFDESMAPVIDDYKRIQGAVIILRGTMQRKLCDNSVENQLMRSLSLLKNDLKTHILSFESSANNLFFGKTKS